MKVPTEAEDIQFEQVADGIASGHFGEEADVDFLNLKELGMDFKVYYNI